MIRLEQRLMCWMCLRVMLWWLGYLVHSYDGLVLAAAADHILWMTEESCSTGADTDHTEAATQDSAALLWLESLLLSWASSYLPPSPPHQCLCCEHHSLLPHLKHYQKQIVSLSVTRVWTIQGTWTLILFQAPSSELNSLAWQLYPPPWTVPE